MRDTFPLRTLRLYGRLDSVHTWLQQTFYFLVANRRFAWSVCEIRFPILDLGIAIFSSSVFQRLDIIGQMEGANVVLYLELVVGKGGKTRFIPRHFVH